MVRQINFVAGVIGEQPGVIDDDPCASIEHLVEMRDGDGDIFIIVYGVPNILIRNFIPVLDGPHFSLFLELDAGPVVKWMAPILFPFHFIQIIT